MTQPKRIIKKELLHSRFLGETKEILVFLPDEHPERELPLLLLHDGPDYFNLGRIVTQAMSLIAGGEVIPLAMAAVPVIKAKRSAQYSPAGAEHAGHVQMVTEELLPLLRSRFPVSRRREDLVIGGSSLGGTVSLHIALSRPDICDRVLSQSGAFLPQTVEAVSGVPDLSLLTVYQSVGLKETAVQTHMGTLDLVARNREVHNLLRKKNARVRYVEAAGDHTWGFWQRDIPDALRFFFGA
ncbi:alpha/beta hydrolase [Staphylospora marina]|uniref:alpha/beta hydrolase n=1 Tax=Staphylospora marina TaxID=2490858 RepID=UPI000F5BB61D|nr:alpha/beta hydrolase-fold protein [Staphylospora marina]